MRNSRNSIAVIGKILIILCGVLVVLIPITPINMPVVNRDSGVFLYIGWRINDGELPYEDIWDHKPPLIYYINALGLKIANSSRWGVWIIEFLVIFVAAWISVEILTNQFGLLSAILSTFLWMITLVFVIDGGNLTEEYALPLQFGCLWLINDYLQQRIYSKKLCLIGLLTGFLFILKQTTVGITLAFVIYLIAQSIVAGQVRKLFVELFYILVGFLLVIGLVGLYFFSQGILIQIWTAVFQFNLAYSMTNTSYLSRLSPVIYGISLLSSSGFFQIAIIGYILAMLLVIYKKSEISGWKPIMKVSLVALPIELLFVCSTGYIFEHYYMTLLPVLSIFAGFTFWIINSKLSEWEINNKAKFVAALYLILIFFWSSFLNYKRQFDSYKSIGEPTIIDFINETSKPDDYVLMWGAESSINFHTLRKSPTRYIYQYPLYQSDFTNSQLIEEFLSDIIKNNPRYIIDTHNHEIPLYNFPIQTQSIIADLSYIKAHYQKTKIIGSWTIYQYSPTVSNSLNFPDQ